jgi:polysaccharide export outer membrane protein
VLIRSRTCGAFARVACALSAAALIACTNTSSMPEAPAVPGFGGDAYAAAAPPYRLQVGDVLQIKLPLMPEFNDEVVVRPDGQISTTFVNDLPAYNRTVPELLAALKTGYGRELRNPVLSLSVRSTTPFRVYVAGEVVTPGEYATPSPNLTLSQALARAGGLKLSAEPTDIFILRRGADDVPTVYSTKYRNVMRGSDPKADVRLARYDVVYVPRSTIAEVYIFFNQYLQQFVPVSWGFSYLVNDNNSSSVVQAPAAVAR